MGCDIHLTVEHRRKKNPYPNDVHEWYDVGFNGTFSSRIYGMFARMAKVRDYYGNKYKVQFEPRGLREDVAWTRTNKCYLNVIGDKGAIEWGEHYCSKENAERWVENGLSEWIGKDHRTLTDPDYHSYSWLTTQELRQCFDDCFKDENGNYKPNSDYVEWLGLISLCEGIESDGINECRVVFWFDN